MDPVRKDKQGRYISFAFRAICFLAALYSLYPVIQNLATNTLGRYARCEVEITPYGGPDSGTELWMPCMASTDLRYEDAELVGENITFEYRTAQEYGYIFDTMVIYPFTAGSVLRFEGEFAHMQTIHLFNSGLSASIQVNAVMKFGGVTLQNRSFIFEQPSEMAGEYRDVQIFTLTSGLTLLAAIPFALLVSLLIFRLIGKAEIFPAPQMQGRDTSLDLMRLFAAFSVDAIHQLNSYGYYNVSLSEWGQIPLSFVRAFLHCCVPIFFLQTGYLQVTKRFEKKYYAKLPHILLIYVVCCLMGSLSDWAIGIPITASGVIRRIVHFELLGFMRTYIGLFLVAPFLNMIWHGLNKLHGKLWLILIALLLTSVPSITNGIMTDEWCVGFPIAYYFIGCFLREYRIGIKRSRIVFLMLLLAAVYTAYVHNYPAANGTFNQMIYGGYANGYNAIPIFAMAVLIFLFFKSITLREGRASGILALYSKHSLEYYLLPFMIVDEWFKLLFPMLYGPDARVPYLLSIVPIVAFEFILTAVLVVIEVWIVKAIEKGAQQIMRAIRREDTAASAN